MLEKRIDRIVRSSVAHLFAQIAGGRIVCESEATLQLHLGRIIASVADLENVGPGETFAIELEKPIKDRGRLDVWFKLIDADGQDRSCAIEMKFFKKVNHAEPNNRYNVFKDINRLEGSKDVADVGYKLVATDHRHYIDWEAYQPGTADFDFRQGSAYTAGFEMVYDGKQGPPIRLRNDYTFEWNETLGPLSYMLVQVPVN